VGDLVADQFLYGEISRVSREAPVFILASLGTRASLVGVLGDDEAGRVLLEKLERASVSCKSIRTVAGTPTTTKVRVLAGQSHSTRQQVIRVDYEDAPI
jgi:bifunctional ADP-heptose synthase (sugar kinase/adenylyltransferase)